MSHAAIRFAGTHDGFARGFRSLRHALGAQRLDEAARYNVELVFEEVVANIVKYGAPDGRRLQVAVLLSPAPDFIGLTFEDNGVPFDPRGQPDREPYSSSVDVRVGGFGLMLVRRAARSLDYQQSPDGHNRLTVTVARSAPG